VRIAERVPPERLALELLDDDAALELHAPSASSRSGATAPDGQLRE
jgi:hypothetical protein